MSRSAQRAIFAKPHSIGLGWESISTEMFFARNYMKYLDLHEKVMFANANTWGINYPQKNFS